MKTNIRKNKKGYIMPLWKEWSTDFLFNLIAKTNNHILGKAAHKAVIKEDVMVTMTDGVRLHTHVIRPKKPGRYPVIMVRSPYVINDFVYRSLLPLFARRGYACVLNSVRGTLASEGDWVPFINEKKDGIDLINWICRQSWCDGNIGGFGGSYLGYVQWGLAGCGHPALKTLFIGVAGASPYHMFWRRGMFRQDIWNVWAAQMMEENRYYMEFPAELYQDALSYSPQLNLGEHLKGKTCDWYTSWITSDRPDAPYWTEGYWGQMKDDVSEIKIPVMLQGGWFDIFLRPQLETYRHLPAEVRKKSRFLIGPWNHGGNTVGQKKLENSERGGMFCIREALDWFDHQLKGRPYPEKTGGIEAYNINTSAWEFFEDDIVPEIYEKYYFSADKALSGPSGLCFSRPDNMTGLNFTYDPNDPVRSKGGNTLGTGAPKDQIGPVKQDRMGERSDVLSFISEPLERDLQLAGKIRAHLCVASDAAATSFTISLCEVEKDGNTYNIRDDISDIRWRNETEIREYASGETAKLEMEMTDVVWKLKKGSRLRVDISSSNFPLYHVHPNSAGSWAAGPEKKTARQTFFCGGENASYIELPVLPK